MPRHVRQHGHLGLDERAVVEPAIARRRAAETRPFFLASCLETLQLGTAHVRANRIPINVVSTDSRLKRLLQLADVVTSCTLALVCGESVQAPRVVPAISPLLRGDGADAGGFGLEINPDFNYVNMYHWLLGETTLVRARHRPSLTMRSRSLFNLKRQVVEGGVADLGHGIRVSEGES